MSFPFTDSFFCYDLKHGAQFLGKCEIVIGVLNIILAIFLYTFNFKTTNVLPKFIWALFAFLNCKFSSFLFLYFYFFIHSFIYNTFILHTFSLRCCCCCLISFLTNRTNFKLIVQFFVH